MKKNKIIALSDHALSTSGVGTQSRYLFNGLVDKGRWSIRQFGAALKHHDYRTISVNEDFIIKPIDGFGSKEMLRVALATERPDGLFIFTDPRFFVWLFEIEDEVHQICPIACGMSGITNPILNLMMIIIMQQILLIVTLTTPMNSLWRDIQKKLILFLMQFQEMFFID